MGRCGSEGGDVELRRDASRDRRHRRVDGDISLERLESKDRVIECTHE